MINWQKYPNTRPEKNNVIIVNNGELYKLWNILSESPWPKEFYWIYESDLLSTIPDEGK